MFLLSIAAFYEHVIPQGDIDNGSVTNLANITGLFNDQ
jgi:hypothetical protein